MLAKEIEWRKFLLCYYSVMKILIAENLTLGPILESDKESYVRLLSDRSVYDQTLRIPYPYRIEDAITWAKLAQELDRNVGRQINYAIRLKNELIGGIGFNDYEKGSHKVELGYWIGKNWWGQGIMPLAVNRTVKIGFEEMGIQRLSATIFENNLQSKRVLEKCGFEYEGFLKNYYFKNGKLISAHLYSKFPQ